MMRNLLTVLILMLMLSCQEKKTTHQGTAAVTKPTEKTTAQYQMPPVYLDSASTEKDILEHLTQRKQEIEDLLKTVAPEQANKIYEGYKKEDDSALYILELRKNKLLEEYINFMSYDEKTDKTTVTIPKEKQPEVKNLENYGVELWYIGEGMTALRRSPDYYYKIFSGKVTPDYLRYLEILQQEEKVLYGADAGIIVPWKEIANRILVREKFLNDFPNCALKNQIQKQLKYYRYDYFLGQANTPVFSYMEPFTIQKEYLKEYQRFLKENPTSETAKILSQLLKDPSFKAWTANLKKLLGEKYD